KEYHLLTVRSFYPSTHLENKTSTRFLYYFSVYENLVKDRSLYSSHPFQQAQKTLLENLCPQKRVQR
ncbi:hypothetical protein, partial [Segatella oulorum]|uniref:hypothetical protein n=1 Tax=Segatella oulorum TaxID=28136 RepID=UPI00360A18CD